MLRERCSGVYNIKQHVGYMLTWSKRCLLVAVSLVGGNMAVPDGIVLFTDQELESAFHKLSLPQCSQLKIRPNQPPRKRQRLSGVETPSLKCDAWSFLHHRIRVLLNLPKDIVKDDVLKILWSVRLVI